MKRQHLISAMCAAAMLVPLAANAQANEGAASRRDPKTTNAAPFQPRQPQAPRLEHTQMSPAQPQAPRLEHGQQPAQPERPRLEQTQMSPAQPQAPRLDSMRMPRQPESMQIQRPAPAGRWDASDKQPK